MYEQLKIYKNPEVQVKNTPSKKVAFGCPQRGLYG
tara:strand:+ start:98 stop:202 length:105 start_codon:yes stop_codon:yes gene_type:complete